MARWTAADISDQHGRTVIVTGASSGLGAEATRVLAKAGAKVIMACRNPDKAQAVADAIDGNTEVRRLDLADLSSVRAFADGLDGDVDVLINNAGVMAAPKGTTADGFERHIGTNHLGPFALTGLLIDRVRDRVVTVSSGLHRLGRIRDDLNWERRRYQRWLAYGQSSWPTCCSPTSSNDGWPRPVGEPFRWRLTPASPRPRGSAETRRYKARSSPAVPRRAPRSARCLCCTRQPRLASGAATASGRTGSCNAPATRHSSAPAAHHETPRSPPNCGSVPNSSPASTTPSNRSDVGPGTRIGVRRRTGRSRHRRAGTWLPVRARNAEAPASRQVRRPSLAGARQPARERR